MSMVNGFLTVPNFLLHNRLLAFFSRLAAKKTTDEDTEDDDEDEDHTAHLQRENHLQQMRDNKHVRPRCPSNPLRFI